MDSKHALEIIDNYIKRLQFIKDNIDNEILHRFIGVQNIAFDIDVSSIYLRHYYFPDENTNNFYLDRDEILKFLKK